MSLSNGGVDELDKSLLLCNETLLESSTDPESIVDSHNTEVHVHFKKKQHKVYPSQCGISQLPPKQQAGFYFTNLKQQSSSHTNHKGHSERLRTEKDLNGHIDHVCLVENDIDIDLVSNASPFDRLLLSQQRDNSEHFEDTSRLIINGDCCRYTSKLDNTVTEVQSRHSVAKYNNTKENTDFNSSGETAVLEHTSVYAADTTTQDIEHISPDFPLPVFIMNLSFCGAGFLG